MIEEAIHLHNEISNELIAQGEAEGVNEESIRATILNVTMCAILVELRKMNETAKEK